MPLDNVNKNLLGKSITSSSGMQKKKKKSKTSMHILLLASAEKSVIYLTGSAHD